MYIPDFILKREIVVGARFIVPQGWRGRARGRDKLVLSQRSETQSKSQRRSSEVSGPY